MSKIHEVLPLASFAEEEDGQLVILTGLSSLLYELEPLPAASRPRLAVRR